MFVGLRRSHIQWVRAKWKSVLIFPFEWVSAGLVYCEIIYDNDKPCEAGSCEMVITLMLVLSL